MVPTQGVEQENGFFVAPVNQFLSRVSHEAGVAIVYGVAKLEDKCSISLCTGQWRRRSNTAFISFFMIYKDVYIRQRDN